MQFKDYYDTLGVKPDASDGELKSAFRKLARKYHPDVSKEAGAEDKFKAVNEAYEALRDPEKRREYDALRARGYRPGEEFQPPPDFGGGFGQSSGEFSDFFESLFGRTGARAGRSGGPRRGRDLHAHAAIDLETAYTGGTQRLDLQGRKLDVKIPAGILPGQTIRLAGQGNPGANGGPAGDVLLEIGVRPHPQFVLDGRNITVTVRLAPWDAALGATVPVPTLAGPVDLKIPAGSDTGRKLRLKGRGMPGQEPGDQYVVLEVYAPAATTDRQRELYEALRSAYE
ncbi:DnaJ C-terminal domain-containing protein [Tahibacter amnicola]|uniref:DnaJ domain-containing protein n=1 Tax=Tahibacter amnicola TaxID=2976241 RepID=A0ABY6BLR7_9GAMM|nr:DnaJ C-terminal domain-containing protein [Tahibacter amnicola]UXI70393.1 DnaJ domain-containing protein [Tahibacter amnicola]